MEGFDIIAVIEFGFAGKFFDSRYQICHRNRTEKEDGGILLYIKNSLKVIKNIAALVYELIRVNLDIENSQQSAGHV